MVTRVIDFADIGEHIVALDLLQPGTPRRDWEQVLISDGMIVVRHPDLQATMEMAVTASAHYQVVSNGRRIMFGVSTTTHRTTVIGVPGIGFCE